MRRFAVLFAVLLAGCGVDPLPEPPSLVGDLLGQACGACDGQGKVTGRPGSVTGADRIWVVNLDGQEPPVTAPVAADGSFELFVSAMEGDEIRLQARRDELRSEPRDAVMVTSGALGAAPRPLSSCFVVAPELAFTDTTVGDAAPKALRLQHTCAAPLQIDAVTLRAPSADFTVTAPAVPLVLAPGAFADVSVDFAPSAVGLREEVLLIEVAQPEVDRRPVTLFGRAR